MFHLLTITGNTGVIVEQFYLRLWRNSGMPKEAHNGFKATLSYLSRNLVCRILCMRVCNTAPVWWSCGLCCAMLQCVKDVDLSRIIPVQWHGDDADSHRRRSFCCCTLSSPLAAPGSAWDNRILVYVTDNSRVCSETFDTLDAWMCWAFCELQEGCFFTVNPFGEEFNRGKTGQICGQYRAVLCAIRGDQKYLQRCLKLKTAWNSEQVCAFCRASNAGDLVYTHFGPAAPHRQTMISTEQFMESRCHMNPWIRIPGFHIELILTDWLHIVDLAITPEVAASVLWLKNRPSYLLFFSI